MPDSQAIEKSKSLEDFAQHLEARLRELETATGGPAPQEVAQVLLGSGSQTAVNGDGPIKTVGVSKKTQALVSVASKLESRILYLESAIPGAAKMPGAATSTKSMVNCCDGCFGAAKTRSVRNDTGPPALALAARALHVPQAPPVNLDELIQKERLQAEAILAQQKEAHALELVKRAAELNHLKSELERTSAMHAQAEAKLSGQAAVMQQQLSQHGNYNEQLAGYEAQLQQTAIQTALHQQQATAYQQEAAASQAQVIAHQQTIIDLEAKLTAQAIELQQHELSGQTHEADLLAMRQKLQDTHELHSPLQARIDTLTAENDALRAELMACKKAALETSIGKTPSPREGTVSDPLFTPTVVATKDFCVPTVIATTSDRACDYHGSQLKRSSDPVSPRVVLNGRPSRPGSLPSSAYAMKLATEIVSPETSILSPRSGPSSSLQVKMVSPVPSATSLPRASGKYLLSAPSTSSLQQSPSKLSRASPVQVRSPRVVRAAAQSFPPGSASIPAYGASLDLSAPDQSPYASPPVAQHITALQLTGFRAPGTPATSPRTPAQLVPSNSYQSYFRSSTSMMGSASSTGQASDRHVFSA